MSQPATPTGVTQRASPLVRVPRGLTVALRDAGIDVPRTARAAGIDPARLEQAEPSLTASELGALFHAVFAPPRDPTIGLSIGRHVKAELFGIVGLVTLSAPTYGAALARCARYKRLLTDLRIDVDRRRDRAAIEVTIPGGSGPSARGRVHTELAFLLTFGQRMVDPPIEPIELALRCEGTHEREHERALGCPVRFGRRRDVLTITSGSLDHPLLSASPDAHALLQTTAERHLAELGDDLLARARAAIEGLLPEGTPALRAVARRLATSERTLQRRLESEGTSYTELVDDTRRRLAERYLREGRHGPSEVSFLLGFTHPSSFHRAFRRWTGSSPARYAASSSLRTT